jgi:ABC-type Zn uptake system ZnuABC Zn-binding protein ZnuA
MGIDRQPYPFDGHATKVTVVGAVTYSAKAPAGTLQSEAKWQVKKIDETTGIVITWADGNTNFDNIATNLSALSYL